MNESSGFRLLDPPEGHQSPPHIEAPRAAYSSLRGRRAAGVRSFLPSDARRRRRPRSQPGHLGCSLGAPGLVGVPLGTGATSGDRRGTRLCTSAGEPRQLGMRPWERLPVAIAAACAPGSRASRFQALSFTSLEQPGSSSGFCHQG